VRYPAKQKAETHAKILAVAARSFREHGSESNGIGGVMKELGLTKGGFYRHFDNKDDLYAEAVAKAFEEMGSRMAAVAEAAPKGKELRAVIESYLSLEHANAPGRGCALATLGPEISRQPLSVRKRINQAMLAYRERMIAYIPGVNLEEKRARFVILFPAMAGVLATARAIADVAGRERMLAGARAFFTNAFAGDDSA
jgi:TetR/AcrR family transcriptional repressor of nem operon